MATVPLMIILMGMTSHALPAVQGGQNFVKPSCECFPWQSPFESNEKRRSSPSDVNKKASVQLGMASAVEAASWTDKISSFVGHEAGDVCNAVLRNPCPSAMTAALGVIAHSAAGINNKANGIKGIEQSAKVIAFVAFCILIILAVGVVKYAFY
eukprot:CAMPEP_0196716986 /NCGR_PEP_ID=MMETSP1091-20130531/414_1 /TAXON_ID=302021 /ORGANISM="Rhodomonas sp., Strain CCMP768" /LENGTH=153 /DNA_ID=CAMNT_0042057197 /DNA_START=295 /DNA_END=756 /DNA_ORIENTATION=+